MVSWLNCVSLEFEETAMSMLKDKLTRFIRLNELVLKLVFCCVI